MNEDNESVDGLRDMDGHSNKTFLNSFFFSHSHMLLFQRMFLWMNCKKKFKNILTHFGVPPECSPRRKRTVSTKEMVKKSSICRILRFAIVKNDLKSKPYKKHTKNMTEAQKAARFQKCCQFLC
jgi:hypothetical protein